MLNQSIFRSYDVRGIYPLELNEEAAFAVGVAFVRNTGAKSVAVGHDARLSSPALFKALAAGLLAGGAQVTTIGQVPTECLYFAVAKYDFEGGIMITASHNPKEYNGFKMLKKDSGTINYVNIKDLLAAIDESISARLESFVDENKILKKDIWDDYIKYILPFSGGSKPFNVVIDPSNGVMGPVIKKIEGELPVKIIPLNFEPDGNFPNHSPNPLEKGSSDQISALIKKEKADFGFMFDADADRVFLVDEMGELVRADVTLLLLAKYFLVKNPGALIAYNAICSKAVPEFVTKWGGKPLRTKVGFVNVRAGLLEHNGVMGGELSGHYCFADYFYMDSGLMACLVLLQIIAQDGRKVSEIVKELSPYIKPSELNFKIEDKQAVLEKVKEKYADGKQDYLDGVTVEYKDWWFNVRASNTEPLLRLTIETDTQELLDQKVEELTKFINQ